MTLLISIDNIDKRTKVIGNLVLTIFKIHQFQKSQNNVIKRHTFIDKTRWQFEISLKH